MLGVFFSLIGIGLVIGIITLPFVGLLVILRGRKEFSCLSCGMLSRRYPPLNMGAGFRMRCGYCGQKALIPSNSPTARRVTAGSVTPPVWTGASPPPLFPKSGISRAAWRFIAWGGAIAVLCFVLFFIFTPKAHYPDATQSAPNDTNAKSAQPATNGPSANPLALSVTLNLSRIENTDQGTILTVETNLPPKMSLTATMLGNGHGAQAEGIVPANHVVQFGPLSGFSTSETGALSPGVYSVEVDMAETAESDAIFGDTWQGLSGPAVIDRAGMKMVSQTFHFKMNPDGSVTNPFPEPAQPAPDNSTAEPAQPAPQAESHSAPEPAPTLSFQPSPGSTDLTPAPVASQQETSGSPSAPQATEVTPGQTPDQVVAILGPPISITTGATPVYNYPHLSIVFARGKVWKIHQFQQPPFMRVR